MLLMDDNCWFDFELTIILSSFFFDFDDDFTNLIWFTLESYSLTFNNGRKLGPVGGL